MTRRTDSSNSRSCVLVVDQLVRALREHKLASSIVRSQPELEHLRMGAEAALAGVALERVQCMQLGRSGPVCGWVGLFAAAGPDSFVCLRCGGKRGEAIP